MSAVVCRSSKVENLMPAASQKAPCPGGMSVPISFSCSMGSPPVPVIALTRGKLVTAAGSRGVSNLRLKPMPPASPVMKRYGGPPMGMEMARKPKKDAYSPYCGSLTCA